MISRSIPFAVTVMAALAVGGCETRDLPRDTVSAGASTGQHFGDRMDAIGRRFERLGRAALANRWEFARYEVNELRESFEEIERMPPPEELEHMDMARLIEPLVESALTDVDSALVRQDAAAFRAAFQAASAHCNECHEVARHPYIIVPAEPGEEVPVLTRVPETR